jgi:flagellar protein FlaG
MKIEGISDIKAINRINSPDTNKNDEAYGVKSNKAGNKDTGTNVREEKERISIGEQELIEAIERANKALRGVDKRFEFSIHEGTKQIMVKIINDETGEVIKEIPPEKILDMVAKMWELAGIIVDRKI